MIMPILQFNLIMEIINAFQAFTPAFIITKDVYKRQPVARYHIVDDFDGCRAFIETVGYPVVVKPDNGVGAAHTLSLIHI